METVKCDRLPRLLLSHNASGCNNLHHPLELSLPHCRHGRKIYSGVHAYRYCNGEDVRKVPYLTWIGTASPDTADLIAAPVRSMRIANAKEMGFDLVSTVNACNFDA